MDADWEKGIFPMGQVPVLQANGHRFPQVWPHHVYFRSFAPKPLVLLANMQQQY
jgi:hypothetical protein